jgi:uncharacterized membrane protein HdeD (DUF308 family)
MARERRKLLRRGSVPLVLHGLIEYGAGVLSIAAPFLFSFESDVATAVSIMIGTAVLILGVVTAAPTGVVRSLPLDSHIVLDYVLALVLMASPFVFGFTDDEPALAYFLILGAFHLLLTVLTRYRKHEEDG